MLRGGTVAGPYVRAACARHQKDRAREMTPGFPYRFDAGRADHAIAFFETVLRLPDVLDEDGQPKPFILEPFQAFIIGSLFGWVDGRGLRRFREAYIEIGKGNGKTPLCAGIGLYGLMMDGEQAAEIYAAAADQDQASILFRDSVRIVDASPDLCGSDDEAGPLRRSGGEHVWELKHPATLSFYRMFSRDSGSKSGTRPHMALLDELHEHPTPEISIKIRAGAKRRLQPLFVEITNSGFDRTSVCWSHHEHSRKVVQGLVEDDRWFSYVCALDEGDDPLKDESCWRKANPSIGAICTEEYLRRQVQTATNMPSEANHVLRLNFCQWTQAETRYFHPGKWAACSEVVRDEELVGVPCVAGLDAGQSDDFSAFALVWLLEDGRVAVRMRYWLPRAAVLMRPDRPYQQWENSGLLTVHDGDVVDYTLIEQDVERLCNQHGVRECAYDRKFIEHMAQNLRGRGLTMTEVPQGLQLNAAIRQVNDWVIAGELRHGGDPILAWMADNAVTVPGPNGLIRLDKAKSKDKIDGIMALVFAARVAMAQPPEVEVNAWIA